MQGRQRHGDGERHLVSPSTSGNRAPARRYPARCGSTPASLGIEIGAFARPGLDVQLVALRGGPPRLVRAVLEAELHFAVFPASSVALANAAGGDVVMLLSLVDRNLHAILAPPEITDPEQLRDKTAGVIAFGGQDDFCLRLALRRMDLVPDVDVRIEERGERSELWAALERGRSRPSR